MSKTSSATGQPAATGQHPDSEHGRVVRGAHEAIDAVEEALSPDADKRRVELAFLDRVLTETFKMTVVNLSAAMRHVPGKDDIEARVATRVGEMRHNPAFKRIAREMEKNLAEEPSFGRFRQNERERSES